MPKKTISDLMLRSLSPPSRGQADYWDAKLPSFGVRVSQGGSKTFILKLNNSRRAIGRYPLLSLSDARTEAKRILAEKTLGKVRPQSITFSNARTLFLDDKARSKKDSTVAEYNRLLNRLTFKGQLADVTHDEILRALSKFKSPSEHAHIVVAAKAFFNWCIKRRYVTENPLNGLSRHQSPTRARVLSDGEITAVWKACDGTFGLIVKLLILTGQRRGEIAALHWEWIDEEARTISFPASITKNRRAHTIPFGQMTYEVLDGIGSKKLLFLARGRDTHFNGWSKSKPILDKKSSVPDWTLHDLRRTFATRLAELGTPPHVIERLLNHVTGQVSAVAAVYNRASYIQEMREAIENWEKYLTALLTRTSQARAT